MAVAGVVLVVLGVVRAVRNLNLDLNWIYNEGKLFVFTWYRALAYKGSFSSLSLSNEQKDLCKVAGF